MTVEYIWIQGENGATMMAKQPQADPKGLFGEKGMTFKDALDIINPLQQLPIVGAIYRELTGDTISPGARLIGGGIYGLGVVGLVGAALNNAVEQDTGHDIAGTALAMVRGESLSDMRAAQLAKNGSQSNPQLAQATYFSGGADPIDPTSLPRGAKMVDVPAGPAADTAKQYAALPTDQAAAIPTPAAEGAAAAAPVAPVSVAQLPPTINPIMGANPAAGAAGPPGSIPSMPSAAGLTGLTGSSRLPSSGTITPAGPALTAAALTENMQPGAGGPLTAAAGPQAALAAAEATKAATTPPTIAGATQSASTLAAAGTTPSRPTDGFFPVPARTNNVVPRVPVATTPTSVGTQPLALSNGERRTVAPVTVSAPPPIDQAGVGGGSSQYVPAGQVPEAMMRALDKYDALMRSRRGGGQVDSSL